jgi:uncharacterized protein
MTHTGRPGAPVATSADAPAAVPIAERVRSAGWAGVERGIDGDGVATLPALLTPGECAALRALYGDDRRFRSRIDMARHRFGEGEYKYLDHPLPATVEELRAALYPPLSAIANRWGAQLRVPGRFPEELGAFLDTCHRAGQRRPTPLILRYRTGGYNTLHQDLYGEVVFPLQVVIGLSRPVEDYTGGELVVLEQRPRAQSRATAVTIPQGGGVVLATRERPVAGTRGHYRAALRHGVSRVLSGERLTLGIIFHDAA